ncbi:NAD(P)/FAD-dependent oxidoreductase, partial [Marinospirillum sp.]|uniref:NAD(P)/FAD-dependent oxidoreductase n=1 Tax=Marinospirillum sp. TaxID=2183934 RepID=UPI003A8B08B8
MAGFHPFAVIGAGLAGLACARTLTEQGFSVQVFEKARGPGGRLSSRRRLDTTFDLGCQALTAQHPDFAAQLQSWENLNWVAPLAEGGSARIGQPRMSALTRHLSEGLALHCQTRIQTLEKTAQGLWQLTDDQGRTLGPFAAVILATPAAQALPLLSPASPQLAAQIQPVREAPIWVGYFALKHLPNPSFLALQPDGEV